MIFLCITVDRLISRWCFGDCFTFSWLSLGRPLLEQSSGNRVTGTVSSAFLLISFSHSHTECKTHKILLKIILLEFTTDYKTNKRFNGQWWRLQKSNHQHAYLLYIADIIIFLSRGSTVEGGSQGGGQQSKLPRRTNTKLAKSVPAFLCT